MLSLHTAAAPTLPSSDRDPSVHLVWAFVCFSFDHSFAYFLLPFLLYYHSYHSFFGARPKNSASFVIDVRIAVWEAFLGPRTTGSTSSSDHLSGVYSQGRQRFGSGSVRTCGLRCGSVPVRGANRTIPNWLTMLEVLVQDWFIPVRSLMTSFLV